MESITISKTEYDRLVKFEVDTQKNRVTAIDKYMVAIGMNKALERRLSEKDAEIQGLEYALLQEKGFVKCLQDELALIKKASVLRFIYWRWVNKK